MGLCERPRIGLGARVKKPAVFLGFVEELCERPRIGLGACMQIPAIFFRIV